MAADPRHIPVLGACRSSWEGPTGARRGPVGVISPVLSSSRSNEANSLDRPRVRPAAGRVSLSRHFGCAPPVPRGEGEPTAPITDVRIVPASSKEVPRDRDAPHSRRADRAHGRCARAQRAGQRSGHPRGRHPRRQASHDRPRRALRRRPSHQRPRPAVLGTAGRSRWRCFATPTAASARARSPRSTRPERVATGHATSTSAAVSDRESGAHSSHMGAGGRCAGGARFAPAESTAASGAARDLLRPAAGRAGGSSSTQAA